MSNFIDELKALLAKPDGSVSSVEPIVKAPTDAPEGLEAIKTRLGTKVNDFSPEAIALAKEESKKIMAKVAELTGSTERSKTMLDAVEEAEAAGQNVVAIGCDCENNHQKTVILGIHPTVLQKLDGHELVLDFAPLGIEFKLVVTSGKDYLTTMSNVAAVIHKEPGEFNMNAPGKKGKGKMFPYTKMPKDFGLNAKGEVDINKLVQDSVDMIKKNEDKPKVFDNVIQLPGPGPKKTIH